MAKTHRVFKTTLDTGKTFYSVSEQATSVDSFRKTTLSIAKNNVTKNRPSTDYQKQLFNSRDNFSVELLESFDSKDAAKTFKSSLVERDSNCINSIKIYKGRVDAKSQILRVDKKDSIQMGGSVYISALRLNTYPLLKGKISTSDNISHPEKGRFFKITSSNIHRK